MHIPTSFYKQKCRFTWTYHRDSKI